MAYAMTKQGSLDNCVTYEFICDAVEDMNAIEDRYRTIGTVAIVLSGTSGLEVYIAGSDKQWNSLSSIGGSAASDTAGLSIYICAQDEVSEGVPDVELPDEYTLYLVPAAEPDSGNLYDEYIYVEGEWEKFGSGKINSNLPIIYKYQEEINFEFNDVINMDYGGKTVIIDDVAKLLDGPAILQIGDHTYDVEMYSAQVTGPDNQTHMMYQGISDDEDAGIGFLMPYSTISIPPKNQQCTLIIFDNNYGNNVSLNVRLTYPGSSSLNSPVDKFYLKTNENGENGIQVATIEDLDNYAANPVFTGSISLGRASGSTIGVNSVAEGNNVVAEGDYSHAEGSGTEASGMASHTEGGGTVATGMAAHAEGSGTQALAAETHAEGSGTTATGTASHAEGNQTIASGKQSHAEGYNTIASGKDSHISGSYNIADSYDNWQEWAANTSYTVGDKVKVTTVNQGNQTVKGYICKTANSDSTFKESKWDNQSGKMNYAEIIGNGTADNARSNARALDWDGNEHLMGDLYVGCNANSTGGTKLPRIPEAPSTNGTYILQAIVTNGTPTYSWVSLSSLSGVTF